MNSAVLSSIPSRKAYIKTFRKYKEGNYGEISEENLREIFPHLTPSQVRLLYKEYKAAINPRTKRSRHGLLRCFIALPPFVGDEVHITAFISFTGRIYFNPYQHSLKNPKPVFAKIAEQFAKNHWDPA